jgi:hypothetical protein
MFGVRRNLAVFLLVFLGSATWAVSAGGASAGVASGSPRYYTVNGISYGNEAVVLTSTGKVTAAVTTGSTNKSIPSGWAGSYSKIFSSAGALKCSSGWVYNSATLAARQSVVAFCDKNLKGTYYADGDTRAWNGGSYNTYGTYRSPNQNS